MVTVGSGVKVAVGSVVTVGSGVKVAVGSMVTVGSSVKVAVGSEVAVGSGVVAEEAGSDVAVGSRGAAPSVGEVSTSGSEGVGVLVGRGTTAVGVEVLAGSEVGSPKLILVSQAKVEIISKVVTIYSEKDFKCFMTAPFFFISSKDVSLIDYSPSQDTRLRRI